MPYLSAVRLGMVMKPLEDGALHLLHALFVLAQPAHLQKLEERELDADERDADERDDVARYASVPEDSATA